MEKEDEIIDRVVRSGQPRRIRERHVVIHSGAALILEDLLINNGDGEVRVVDVRDPVVAAPESQDGLLAVLAPNLQARVAAVGTVVAQEICRLVVEIERVLDADVAALVLLQAHGSVVAVVAVSGEQEGKEKRHHRRPQPVT